MSAPSNAYFIIDFNFRGSNNVAMNVNPAKSQADLATLKSRFYLDDVIGFTANYAGVQYHGFWGTCIQGGANEYMHKSTRLLEIHGDTLGQPKKTFNDAGLNTKGLVLSPSIGTPNPGGVPDILQFAGQIKISSGFRSAYYVPTDSYGFYISRNGAAFSKQAIGGVIGAAGTVSYDASFPYGDLKFGDNFAIDMFLDNAEGEYRVSAGTYQVNAGYMLNVWVATYASWACAHSNGAEQMTLYAKGNPVTMGDQIYLDPSCALGTEWRFNRGLSFGGDWIKTNDEGIVQYVGICGGAYPPDDPASIRYDVVIFKYYADDLENGCLAASGGNEQDVTTYQNRLNELYYISAAAGNAGGTSGYVPDGYYWVTLGANSFYYIIQSGQKTGQGSCPF